jgi:DNA invertase Pin-like site-specific DNA recombinase
MAEDSPEGPQLVGYARVSTEDQRLDLQLDSLKAAGCIHIHVEKVSAASKYRPKLELAIKALHPGDTLVVWRLDRLARSMVDLHKRLEVITGLGAGFRSLTEHFDTVSAGGRLLMHILAAIAEFERQLIAERTAAGMKAARARGVIMGSPTVMTPKVRAKIFRLAKIEGAGRLTMAEIADKAGIAESSIYGHYKGGRTAVLNAKGK